MPPWAMEASTPSSNLFITLLQPNFKTTQIKILNKELNQSPTHTYALREEAPKSNRDSRKN